MVAIKKCAKNKTLLNNHLKNNSHEKIYVFNSAIHNGFEFL